MVPVSTAPSFAFVGSLLAHAAIAAALAGVGHVPFVSREPAAPSPLVTFEAIEPEPKFEPEPEPPVAVPPAPRVVARAEPPRPQREPAREPARAPEPPVAPVPPAAPVPVPPEPVAAAPAMPVATVDASADRDAIAVPQGPAGTSPTSAGVIAAKAPPGSTARGPVASAIAGSDRSRRGGLADGARWDCPFPAEAEYEGIERAKAVLRVEIDRSGQPRKVVVTQDPGHGFGREARRCALRRRWISSLDATGAPAPDAVTVVVNFERS